MRWTAALACLGILASHPAPAGAADANPDGKTAEDDRKAQENNRRIEARLERQRQQEARRYARIQDMLRVKADPAACVASHNREGGCLVSVSQFNAFAGTVEPDGAMDADRVRTVRLAMLRELLREAYLADKLRATGLGKEVAEKGMAEEAQVWATAAKHVGQERLRSLYALFGDFFARREDRTYEVMASTDSLLLDSLRREAVRPRAGKEAPGSPSRDGAPGPGRSEALPWAVVADSLLPAPLADSGKALRKWQCSPVLRWKGGFAVIRPADIRVTPAVPYEDAVPVLVGLANYRPLDSARAVAEAQAYYQAHPGEFAAHDTLVAEVRLHPGTKPDTSLDRRTAAFARMSSVDLPADARRWLEGRDSLRTGRTYGPEYRGLGVWTFRLLVARKGKGGPAFDAVRGALMARLARERASAALGLASLDLQRKRRDRGMRIFEALMDERLVPAPEEIARLAATGAAALGVSANGPPEQVRQDTETMAKLRLLQEKRDQSFATWMESSVTLNGI